MIEVLNGFPPTVIGFACKTQVTKEDNEHVLIPTVAQTLADYQKVRLYFQIDPNFAGVEGVAEEELATLPNRIEKFLIAVEDSAASLKAVSYVSQIIQGRTDIHVRLLHVLPPIPPGLLEFGGAEQPQLEQRLSGELRQDQARWIEAAKRNARASLNKALAILLQGGLFPNKVSTSFSSPIHRPDVAHEILKAAQTWKCGTLVVGRHSRSWIREIRSSHVGEDLVRKGQGLAIWVVE